MDNMHSFNKYLEDEDNTTNNVTKLEHLNLKQFFKYFDIFFVR